ncbi:MAG: hypothetical protein AB8F95_16820 [Bacteroidia bacterium]
MSNQYQRERDDHEIEVQEYEVLDGPFTEVPEKVANRTRTRNEENTEGKPARKNKHGWAFFLCSLFIGLGITATTEAPIGLFGGLGVGFLFFVDPIYQRVMDLFE